MTKFNQPKFGTGANSKAFVDNWDRAFGRVGEESVVSGGVWVHVETRCGICDEEWPKDSSGKLVPGCECGVNQ